MKKIFKILSIFLSVCLLTCTTTVFADDSVPSQKIRYGTPKEWEDLRNETAYLQQTLYSTNYSNQYPKNAGDILVTDAKFNFQNPKAWVGHAGIVYNSKHTLEAFPFRNPTVQYEDNIWEDTYSSQDIYGLTVQAANTTQKREALNYCIRRHEQSGSCYNLLAGKGSDTRINCASLIWHGYNKYAGISISEVTSGPVTPISLVDSPNTTIIYRYSGY